ncbi:MAG: type II secretion system protein [Candidatus Pacebacteria bacterium]|nr:type II secretion system protein [Candidatus Paceibacterota bacterium]
MTSENLPAMKDIAESHFASDLVATHKRYMSHIVKSAFTLIELLVVIAIISLLVSILLPSLNKAKDLAKSVVCLNSLKSQGTMLAIYMTDSSNQFPTRAPDGGGFFGEFTAWRLLLNSAELPDLKMLACPSDLPSARNFSAAVNNKWALGISDMYGLSSTAQVKVSYGLNLYATYCDGVNRFYDPNPDSYGDLSRTMFDGDSAYYLFNNYLERITLANFSGCWPEGQADPFDETMARHFDSSNMLFMDMHAESLTQTKVFDMEVLPVSYR